MSEEMTSKHGLLKYRLKSRITEEIFSAMPTEVQNYLLNMEQEDIKENHLSAMLSLPWLAEKAPNIVDLRVAKGTLDRSHYAMEGVKEKIMRYMACQKHLGRSYGAVLLLAGPPGVGKTSIALSIARAMGRPCVKISLAGVADAYFLRGVQQVFRNAHHGRIIEAVIRSGSFSPVILLDEIDKMGSSQEHGRPENVLLDLLDSDRSRFVDNFLGFPVDLSDAIFIATANDLDVLSPVLKDRLDIVELPPYDEKDKLRIVMDYIWPKLLKEYNLESLDELCDDLDMMAHALQPLELKEDAALALIRMCPEEGVRDLERICRNLCESVISIWYANRALVRAIDENNLDALLQPVFYK
ncbi:MAG: AAA family ATPase [Clostridia bacterium]|nr:AAA family ATPase [Clostridia bacterium]